MLKKTINVLGLESSCDDTAAAIVNGSSKILSNIVISQNEEHQPYSGVVPEIAARSHMTNVKKAIKLALESANLNLQDIDLIASTTGPGLIGGVIVGSMVGRALSSVLRKPFISVNHLEGHALTARLTDNVEYPYLLLLVSGGHCQFVAVLELGKYKILGRTLDDAVGEAFDKVAKMLKLPFPGGPEIEKIAQFGDPHKFVLPKPIIKQPGCNMSFSGLKTAVSNLIEKHDLTQPKLVADIAASFQNIVGEVLCAKMKNAISHYEEFAKQRIIVISGGVAANQYLINILRTEASNYNYRLISPPIKLCTDNAAMIAWVGLERYRAGLADKNYFCPKARWSLEDL